jgi:hypothetical protein
MIGRHLLSHSFTEKGQRKKIIDDHDKLCSKIEISKLLSNNKIFPHKYQFSNISLMFVQLSEVISAKKIFYCLCLNGSVHKYAYFSKKDKKLINSNQNPNRKQTKNANKIFT